MTTIEHLESNRIDVIALALGEDVYGTNGDLSVRQIRQHLIENIHSGTGHKHVETGMIPIHSVADLILGVWRYQDRRLLEQMARSVNATRRSVVRVGNLRCGNCSRLVSAADMDVDDDRVRLICRHCHRDLIHIEPRAFGE